MTHEAYSEMVDLLKVAVWPLYLIIAAQFALAARSAHNARRTTALGALVFIFVACDISGYAGPVLGWSPVVMVISHLVIIVSCILFIMLNGARHAMAD